MRRERGAPSLPLALLAIAVAGSWQAASAETLEDAWQLALARDKALAAAGADVEGARAAEQAARGARWPSLDATAGYTRLDESPALDVATPGGTFRSGPIFKDDQFVSGSVQLKVPLYTGGQLSAGIDAAHHAVIGAVEDEQSATAALKLDVAEAYVGVLRARRALEAASSSVESLTAHANDVQHMVERDLVPKADMLAARVASANAEQARVRAANSVEIAQAAYNRRLGEPLGRSAELDRRISADASLTASAVDALIQRALGSRSELKALEARADSLVSQSHGESAKALPQVALTGGYSHLDNQILDRQDVAMVGVGFTWNLFDGGQARHRAAALRSASRAAQNRLDDLRSSIELQVRQAWLDVHEAQARLRASGEAVAQAEENLRSSRELYGAGLATNTQVLDAVTLRISAINNRDNAALDESLSLLRLSYAVGAL
ncbi:MAG TPA: TolC family protein [Steroidobacteraceae bacterium]|nr:TolC family protein [Steroidobacteraceae bacterium]